MSLLHLEANGQGWAWSPPDPVQSAERFRAIMEATLVDEVTGVPFGGRARVSTSIPHAAARICGSIAGIAGRPTALFAPPGIAAAPLDLDIAAEGFLPLALRSTMGAQPGFPAAFAPRMLGAVALHREGCVLFGRVIAANGQGLVGAIVTQSGVWSTLASTTGAAQAANLMPTPAGFYADRSGAAAVRRRNFTPAAERKTIAAAIDAGTTEVVLSDRIAIAAGDVLMLDPDYAECELVRIVALDTGSSVDQPALATLTFPLARARMPGAIAVRGVSGPSGAANALARAARRGDVSTWTAALSGIGPATAGIEISGGGPADPEYHFAAPYRTKSVTGGAFALPPLHRLAAVQLTATHASLGSPIVRRFDLEFGAQRLRADLVAP